MRLGAGSWILVAATNSPLQARLRIQAILTHHERPRTSKEFRMTEPLLAAFAEVNITPAVEMGDHGGRRRRSFTVHDPLMARLCVLRQGATTAVLAGIDALELGGNFEEQVGAHLAGTGIGSDSLLFSPSHVGMSPISHYGAYIIVFAQDLIINDFEAVCAARIAAGIRQALADLTPVRVAAGVGHAPGIARNRRWLTPEGAVEMVGLNASLPTETNWTEQHVDDTVRVIRFDTIAGEQLGALVNFGCHALCSDDRYGDITADYPQHAAAVFRRAAGIPIVFTQGSIGQQIPTEADGARSARRIGRALGAQALYTFEQIAPKQSLELVVHSTQASVPVRRVAEEPAAMRSDLRNSRARYRRYLFERFHENPSLAYPIRAVTLGDDIALVALPGEVFQETVTAIQEASPYWHTIVLSRASRDVGYVPVPGAFAQGGMEPALTSLTPASEPIIRQSALEHLRRCKAAAPVAGRA